LSGNPLTGHALVRHIYSDEAGVSAKETVSVVVSLIVHTDTQWKPVVGRMAQLVQQHVPKEYWPTFALHTKTLVRQKTYPNWEKPSRYAFPREVMRIPRQAGIPICVGAVRRGTQPLAKVALTADQQDHALAFVLSMSQADKIIRNRCGDEMATVIAEDHRDMKRALRGAIDEALFMDRYGSPFLQIADACAYGIRRYYSDQPYGDSYSARCSSGRASPTTSTKPPST
jgi:hypothetical protein